MKCTNCDAENEARFKFCETCGTPLFKPLQTLSNQGIVAHSELKKCPFCAESIQVDAKKCRYCGEFLEGGPKPKLATYVKETSRNNAVYIESDGDKENLIELITSAIRDSGGYLLTSVDERSGLIRFETGSLTFWSNAGEEITASVASTEFGASAMFVAKTKPAGMMRLSFGVGAGGHVQKLIGYMKVK